MRFHALKGLGLIDVDLTSCHTYILLAFFKDQLPLLNEAIVSNNLWSTYQDYYETGGLPFYKKLVKAMHYASILGGGDKAFRKAVHQFNIYRGLNGEPLLSVKEAEAIIALHKKSPLYKELTGIRNILQKEWCGKQLILPSGESFKVQPYRRYKDKKTNQYIVDKGNFLTAFSAFLQSIEVLLVSYMILRAGPFFTPLLWQHDGLTIKAHSEDTTSLMQEALNEACELFLGETKIPLTINELG